jgi:hypothetical protein
MNFKQNDKLSEQIVKQLALISVNCRHSELVANISGLDESAFSLGGGQKILANANELQDRNQSPL